MTADAGARVAISKLRDSYAPSQSGPISVEGLRDWQALNEVLDECDRTLAWYDALPPDERARDSSLERDIAPLLIKAGRWADAGALYAEPLKTINRAIEDVASTSARARFQEQRPELARHLADSFRATAGRLVRALSAAGRDVDADLVERRALDFDSSAEMVTALANARRQS